MTMAGPHQAVAIRKNSIKDPGGTRRIASPTYHENYLSEERPAGFCKTLYRARFVTAMFRLPSASAMTRSAFASKVKRRSSTDQWTPYRRAFLHIPLPEKSVWGSIGGAPPAGDA